MKIIENIVFCIEFCIEFFITSHFKHNFIYIFILYLNIIFHLIDFLFQLMFQSMVCLRIQQNINIILISRKQYISFQFKWSFILRSKHFSHVFHNNLIFNALHIELDLYYIPTGALYRRLYFTLNHNLMEISFDLILLTNYLFYINTESELNFNQLLYIEKVYQKFKSIII